MVRDKSARFQVGWAKRLRRKSWRDVQKVSDGVYPRVMKNMRGTRHRSARAAVTDRGMPSAEQAKQARQFNWGAVVTRIAQAGWSGTPATPYQCNRIARTRWRSEVYAHGQYQFSRCERRDVQEHVSC